MPQPPRDLVVYNVDQDAGVITRTDHGTTEEMADYNAETGIVSIREGKLNYKVAIIRHLNDKGWKYTGLTSEAIETNENIPKKPRWNPRLGDKTPKYVQWLARYKKAEFIASFNCKQLQHLVGYNEWVAKIRNEDTGVWVDVPQKEPIYENLDGMDYDVNKLISKDQRIIADRKSILTVKLADNENDEMYDWDADATVEDRREDGGVIPTVRMIRG